MDELDLAAEREQMFRENALREAAKNAEEFDADFDGESCLDCGTEMPALRLQMKRVRCVHCQTRKEATAKLYR